MNKVQAAADAISAAIRGVKPWLTPETWEGNAATAWAGEWESFYHAVQSCLNDLPFAESAIVSAGPDADDADRSTTPLGIERLSAPVRLAPRDERAALLWQGERSAERG